jgi:hypothetical protein
MEINITSFFRTVAPRDLSASVAEIGRDAGAYTWQASMEAAEETRLLDTDEKREAFRAWVGDWGAWDEEEINSWDDVHLNALCLQWIAGDMREPVGFELGPNTTDSQWAEYQAQSEAGQVAGRIFRADDGQVYFSLN